MSTKLVTKASPAILFQAKSTVCHGTSHFHSGIKFDKSTAEERHLNQTFELSSAKQLSSRSSVGLHDSGKAAIQTSCLVAGSRGDHEENSPIRGMRIEYYQKLYQK